MARRSDPVRIETARRAAAIARLVSAGWSTGGATALVAEWEALGQAAGGAPTRTDWESFEAWLGARSSPKPQAPDSGRQEV